MGLVMQLEWVDLLLLNRVILKGLEIKIGRLVDSNLIICSFE